MLDLSRIIKAFLLREADAKSILTNYLKSGIDETLLKGVNIGNILGGLYNRAPKGIDYDVMAEDVVEDFIQQDALKDLIPDLEVALSRDHNLDRDVAEKVVDPRSKIPEGVNEDKLKETSKKLIGKFLASGLYRRMLDWLKKHEDKSLEDLVEKGVQIKDLPTVKQDWEEMEDQAEEEGWEKGLISKSHDIIKFKAKNEELQKLLLKVFDDIIIAEKPKTHKTLANEFNVPEDTIDRARVKILTWLKESPILKEQIEKGKKHYQFRKEEIPDYTDYLGDEDKSDQLKDFLKKETRGKKSEVSEQAYDLFAEGKTKEEVGKEIDVPSKILQQFKDRFIKKYNEWYVQTQRTAGLRIIAAMLQERFFSFPKRLREIAMKISAEDNGGITPELFNTFEKKVEQKINKKPSPFNIEVDFKSDFDNITKTEEDKDPNFKYEEYRANFKVKDLQIGSRLWNLDYTYTQPLNPDGSFKGTGSADIVMYAENKKTGEKEKYDPEEMKNLLTNHVKKELLPEGVNPHGGLSVIYYNKNSRMPAKYREIPGVEQLKKRFQGVADWAGPLHKERIRKEEEKEETIRLRKFGPRPLEHGEEKENRRMISELRRELKEEKLKGTKADKKRIQDLMKEISYLEDLVSKAQSARERVEDMTKKEKEELKSMLEEEKRRLGLRSAALAYNLRKLASQIILAQSLPGPQMLEVKKLFEMAEDYKISRPNPRLWMNADDVRVFGAALRSEIQQELKNKTTKIKKGEIKVESKKKAIEEAQQEADRKLAQASRWVEKIPEDLKKRRDLMKKQSPDAYEKYFRAGSNRDPDWVDDKDKVESTISKTQDVMQKGLDLEKPREKQYQLIDIGEFDVLENFAKEVQAGTLPLAKKFAESPVEKTEINKEYIEAVKGAHDKLVKYQEKLNQEIQNLDLPPDITLTKDLERMQKDLKRSVAISSGQQKTIEKEKAGPAYITAGALLSHLDYFSELYNALSTYLWFRREHVVKSGYDIISKDVTIADLKKWQDRISEAAKKLSGITPLRSKSSEEAIKGILREIRPKLRDFRYQLIKSPELYEPVEEEKEEKKRDIVPELPPKLQQVFREWGKVEIPLIPKLRRDLNRELMKPESERDKEKIKEIENDILKIFKEQKERKEERDKFKAASLPYNIISADKPTREEMITKSIFPEDEMQAAKRLIDKIGEKISIDMKNQAQEYLDNLVDGMTALYKQGMPIDIVRDVAKEKNISEDKARLFIKEAMSRMVQAGLREFMDNWREKLESPWKEKAVERSPLGNKPAEEYKAMWDYVKHHIPGIDKVKEPLEPVEEPPMAIPTSKAIMDSVKRFFKQKELTEDQAAKIFRAELAEAEGRAEGGASKGKGKKRPKAIKPPPPQGTWQELKQQFASIMKGNKEGFGVVQDILLPYVLRTRKTIQEALKKEEPVDTGAIVDGLVYLAKNIENLIKGLRVGPSEAALKKLKLEGEGSFPSGGRRLVSRPDITIDNLKEAEEFADKMRDIYKWVNHYISPDTRGVPPESLEKMTKLREYWPANFGALLDEFQKAEGKKTSSELFWEETKQKLGLKSSLMSYKVAEKFASIKNESESVEEVVMSTEEVFEQVLK